MYLVLAIGIPIFLVFGGGLLALAFAGPQEHETMQEKIGQEAGERKDAPPVFFRPADLQARPGRMTADDLLLSIEAHLRSESRAVEVFASDPNATNLWLEERLN